MAVTDGQDRLIRSLSEGLAPVRRLPSPGLRTLAWTGAVLLVAILIALFADLRLFVTHIVATPDLWLAWLGSILTALLAAFAAFQLSVPGRSKVWACLPLPALLLWIGASGMGCLRSFNVPGLRDPSMHETQDCLLVIIGLSIPLSLLMIVMLRRAAPLYPAITASVAGLACAAGAASLLALFHGFDVTAADLGMHLIAVVMVVGANRISGGRLFSAT